MQNIPGEDTEEDEMEQRSKELSSKMMAEKMELEEVVAKKEKEYTDMMNEVSGEEG